MMTGQEIARAFDDVTATMDLVAATVDTDPVTALAYMRALEPTLERLAEHAPGQARPRSANALQSFEASLPTPSDDSRH